MCIRLLLVVSFALTAVPGTAQAEECETTYTVRKSDTLSRIARRFTKRYKKRSKHYKITSRSLRRWNRLKSNRIHKGQKLVIQKPISMCRLRSVQYKIQRKDTLIRIAKQFDVRVEQIKRWNRLRSDRIRRGKVLTIIVPGPKTPSVSHGKPNKGRLHNGEKLPDGRVHGWGYRSKKPKYSYGANKTITHLIECIQKVKRRWPRVNDVVIGDLSRQGGGPLPPHVSHQNGLDVDIGYYFKDRKQLTYFKSATSRNMDVRKSWYLLKTFLDTDDVDMIFVDYDLQAHFYRYAKRTGMSPKELKRVFQYPRGRGVARGTIRHSKGHRNHFHIRFNPPAARP